MIDMYASKTGLLTALRTIQEECKYHNACSTCPLRVIRDDARIVHCGLIKGQPCDWNINDVMDWRAFK